MNRNRTIRVVVLLTVVVSAVSVLIAVLLPLMLGWSSVTPAAKVWWLMPLAAAGVLGGVTWMLLLETPKREQPAGAARPLETCPRCGREVAEGWRLCPWCGTRPGSDGRPE